ncbi:MAG: DMT family transporter [Elusimicrobiota bacterium]
MLARTGLSFACFLWAISFIATKVALAAVPPLTVVSLRLAVSGACFLPWLFRRWRSIRSGGLWRLLGLSLVGTTLHHGTQTVGLQFTSASNASLYAATCPICIALIAAVFLGERITRRKAAGIALALAGVLVVLGLGTLRSFDARGHLLGDALVFVSIFLWGVFTVFGKSAGAEMGAFELIGAATVLGALLSAPAGLLEMSSRGFSLASIPARAWGGILFLGVACGFLANLLYFLALDKLETGKVGVYLYTIPPMTYAAAAVILGERAGPNLLVGSSLVLAGVYLTERG